MGGEKRGEWGFHRAERGSGSRRGHCVGGLRGEKGGFYGVERESGGDLGGFWSGKGGMGSLRC